MKKIIILLIWLLSLNIYGQGVSRYLTEYTSYSINLSFFNTPLAASKLLDTSQTYIYKGDCVGAVKLLLGKRSDEICVIGELPAYSLMTFDFYGGDCDDLSPKNVLLNKISKRYGFHLADTLLFMPVYVTNIVDSNKFKGFIDTNIIGGRMFPYNDEIVLVNMPIDAFFNYISEIIDKSIITDTLNTQVSLTIPLSIIKNEETLREYIRTHFGISLEKEVREVKVTRIIFN